MFIGSKILENAETKEWKVFETGTFESYCSAQKFGEDWLKEKSESQFPNKLIWRITKEEKK